MTNLAEAWAQCLPDVRNAVTGVGVWAALNTCQPVVLEDGVLVIGLPHQSAELAGHLKLAATKTLIEKAMGAKLGQPVTLRVIDGTSAEDWETVKRRDAEAARLRDQAIQRATQEVKARSSWDTVYEQLNRAYAATQNKSLPQNRASFYLGAIEIMAEALLVHPITDDLAERNYARCIERVAQYSEVPSVLVAIDIMRRTSG